MEEPTDTGMEQPIDPGDWIRQACLMRLQEASHKGISQAVLCAVIRHETPEELGFVGAKDIEAQLRKLKEGGRVQYSAGRWKV